MQEVRRKFKADPGIIQGTSLPDYKTCISISSAGALSEMRIPALISVATPLVTGFIFGAEFVGGLLIGTRSPLSCCSTTANAGGAWDMGRVCGRKEHYGGRDPMRTRQLSLVIPSAIHEGYRRTSWIS